VARAETPNDSIERLARLFDERITSLYEDRRSSAVVEEREDWRSLGEDIRKKCRRLDEQIHRFDIDGWRMLRGSRLAAVLVLALTSIAAVSAYSYRASLLATLCIGALLVDAAMLIAVRKMIIKARKARQCAAERILAERAYSESVLAYSESILALSSEKTYGSDRTEEPPVAQSATTEAR